MFTKSSTAAALATYASAQTALVTPYTSADGSTGTITFGTTAATPSVNSNTTVTVQSLVNGDSSYSIVNAVFAMTMATGTIDTTAIFQQAACYPVTKTVSGTTTTTAECLII